MQLKLFTPEAPVRHVVRAHYIFVEKMNEYLYSGPTKFVLYLMSLYAYAS